MCGGSKNPDGAVVEVVAVEPDVKRLSKATPSIKRVPTKKVLDAILASKELTNALETFLASEFCMYTIRVV